MFNPAIFIITIDTFQHDCKLPNLIYLSFQMNLSMENQQLFL